MQLRLAFSKKGMIKFISHLDTVRVFTRAIQRAKIPVLWSEGFNPHQKLSIAQPLSVGTESEYEVADLEVEDGTDPEAVKRALNEALPDGIRILAIKDDFDATSVFERIETSRYRLFFPATIYPAIEALEEITERALAREEILVRRRKKKGKKRIFVDEDIKPDIFSIEWKEERGGSALYALLKAGGHGNLRPDRFLAGIFEESGLDTDYVQIRRMMSMDRDGNEVQI